MKTKMPDFDLLSVAVIAEKTYRITTLQKELQEDYRNLKPFF